MLKKSASLLHRPHVIVVGLLVRKINPIFPTPEKVGPVQLWTVVYSCIQDEAMNIAGSAPHGTHYHADAIYLLPYRRKKEGNKGLMVLRVKPAPTRFTTNRLYTPMDSIPLHSLLNVCCPWGSSCSFASQSLNLLQRIDICQVRLN